MSKADFIESTVLTAGLGRREWVETTWAAMQAKGATHARVSHPIDQPDHMWLEGWKVRPDDQGPHPWEERTRPAVTRTIAADLTPRIPALHATMGQLFLRYDGTHELPLVVEIENGRAIARFEKPGDLASFISPDRKTLPVEFMRRIEFADAEKAGQRSLV